MALRNTTRKATALVPVAAPVIVEALRAGPLTTQELWAKCISDSVQNAGDSAGSGLGERLGLHQVFKAKSDLKQRILPIMKANAIIEQHHLSYPQARTADPSKRLDMIIDKMVSKKAKSKSSSSSSSTSSSSTSKSAPATASTSGSSGAHSEFVWSLNHHLLEPAQQTPLLVDEQAASRLQDRLSRMSSGTESVHYITSQTRDEKEALRQARRDSKILSISEVQNVWSRPQGVLNPKRYGSEAEDWVSSEEERQHLNKRRGLKRVEKERKMVRLVKVLTDAWQGKATTA